jgi:PAS domain S-box-containing protein
VGFFNTKKNNNPQTTTQQGGVAVSGSYHLNSDFILGTIEDGVIMVGKDNTIQLINPAASRIIEWPAEEAVGLDFHSVLNVTNEKGEPLPDNLRPFPKALASGQTIRENNLHLTTKTGKRVMLSIIVSPLFEAEGKPAVGAIGVFRDITQEKQEEAQRSDFISTASHEMRTPVAAIEGYLALALNPKIAKIDDNARKLLDKASASTKHLGVLFQDLLTSSRAEDGRLQSFPQVIEMGEISAASSRSRTFPCSGKRPHTTLCAKQ